MGLDAGMGKPKIVESQTWTPPKPGPRAKQKRSTTEFTLTTVDLPGDGPEDVAIDADGNLYTGLIDGRILRITADGATTVVADTGGRPLGVEVGPDGSLTVADPFKGLLNVDPSSGTVTTIVDRIDGVPMLFCDNSTIAPDGTTYFTDSSTRFGLDHYTGELLAHSGSGRLFRRTPDGAIDLVLGGLQFANGVALSPDGSWLVVAETGGYCLRKVWLTGERAGQDETVVQNMPGFPDNVSIGSDGLIWVALPSPRDPVLDMLLRRPVWTRKLAWAMPAALQPKPKKTAWVQAYDVDGTLVHDLQTRHPTLHMITGVRELNGTVWLGSLHSPMVGRIDLNG